MVERTQIKFSIDEKTNDVIGFVSRNAKSKKLKGVREQSEFRKKICVLSEDLKGKVIPGTLYDVELKEMHKKNGYVVVAANPKKIDATVELIVKPYKTYQILVNFGYKVIYFDPINGKSRYSKTVEGVIDVINQRNDLKDKEKVINEFKTKSIQLLAILKEDGYL